MAQLPTVIVEWPRRNPPQYSLQRLKMGTYWIWKIHRQVLHREMKISRALSSTIGLFRNRSSRIWCPRRPSRSLKRLRSSRMRSGGACSHTLWCLPINSTQISPKASPWKLLFYWVPQNQSNTIIEGRWPTSLVVNSLCVRYRFQ